MRMSGLACRLRAPWAALSFLTCLVPPPRGLHESELIAAVPWYPLAGLAVGICAVLPLWCGLAAPYPAVQGWMYVLLGLWVTRALHWDGLADVADAWGSGRRGSAFHAVLKDSRIGAFGVIALVMGLTGQSLLAGLACGAGHWGALLLAPLAGRCAALVLAAACPAHAGSSLGRLVVLGVTLRQVLAWGCVFAVPAFWLFGWGRTVLLAAALAAGLQALRRLALREGGVNGDFFGTAILMTETAVLAAGL